MSTTNITRKQLVSIARLSIADTRKEGREVPTSLARSLMKIARTVPAISGDWRVGDCGCLIGTYYGDKFVSSDGLPSRDYGIGVNFWIRLKPIVGGQNFSEVVTVIDEDPA